MEKVRRQSALLLLTVLAIIAIKIIRFSGEAQAAAGASPAETAGHLVGSSRHLADFASIPAAPDVTHTITFVPFSYTPSDLIIHPGDTIQWQGDFSSHPLVSDGGLWQTVGAGPTFSFTFNTLGVYRFHCAIHGGPNGLGMSGVIRVTLDTYLPLMTR